MSDKIGAFYTQEWFRLIVSAVTGFLVYIGKSLWDKRKEKKIEIKEEQMINGMRSIATVYSCMEHITNLKSIGRVFLLEVSNSGDVAMPGSKIYSRGIEINIDRNEMMNQSYGINFNLRQFEETEVDAQYINMVVQAKVSRIPYVIKTREHENCLLRNIYLEQGIEYAEIYHIYSDTKKWKEYILSVSSYDEGILEYVDTIRPIIDNNIQQIRYNFKRYR